MQAVAETLFVWSIWSPSLLSGSGWIRGSRGDRQFLLFGWMAVVLGAGDSFHLVPRALALCTTGLENYTVPLGLGKWITSVTMTVFYVLLYYVWRLRYRVLAGTASRAAVYGSGRTPDPFMHDAAEPVAQCRRAAFLGDLPQYPLCPAGTSGDRAVFRQCQEEWGTGHSDGGALPLC